jgi:disulfide bond formation protein DsbB
MASYVLVSFVTTVLSCLTLVADLALAVFVFLLLFLLFGKPGKKTGFLARTINRFWLLGAFKVSLAATLGSLFFSEVAGYAPCELCWFQRIFMYPLVLIFGVGLVRKDAQGARKYALPLAAVGTSIAAYHFYIQVLSKAASTAITTTCSGGVSCTTDYFSRFFGYITIPTMSLSAFLLILVLLAFGCSRFSENLPRKKGD